MKKLLLLITILIPMLLEAQTVERTLPASWHNLVKGGSFIDRFLPIPIVGKMTKDTWGSTTVLPRDKENGIEDPKWSYWGGRFFKTADGKYNSFICRWHENDPRGHWAYPYSEIVWVQSDNPIGPYKPVAKPVGSGHNPNLIHLTNGDWFIYTVYKGSGIKYYSSKSLKGPWKLKPLTFDLRDRKDIKPKVNMTFVQREDGSCLSVPRGGDVWISRTGESTYNRVSNGISYPGIKGKFEDPVIWKDDIQYNMIVNDWYGRIAYYLRSKDGVNWKTDPGMAYAPGVSKYEDGTTTHWYKYERPRILQDKYGRAEQVNFAVIDTLKHWDFPNDKHSAKNISIPLEKGKLLTILNTKKIDNNTKKINLLIKSEKDFNAQTDIDYSTLHFGASEVVNFGKGSKLISHKNKGKDVVLTFEGENNSLTEDNFTAKLLGKKKDGNLLFAYARLPWVDYNEPILSTRKPYVDGDNIKMEVENFGLTKSSKEIVNFNFGDTKYKGIISSLKPYEKHIIEIKNTKHLKSNQTDVIKVEITNTSNKILYAAKRNLQYNKRNVFIEKTKQTTAPEYMQAGLITNRVSKGDCSVKYHIYAPKSYTPRSRFPMAICFSFNKSGKEYLETLKKTADIGQYIIVTLDEQLTAKVDNKSIDEFVTEAIQIIGHKKGNICVVSDEKDADIIKYIKNKHKGEFNKTYNRDEFEKDILK